MGNFHRVEPYEFSPPCPDEPECFCCGDYGWVVVGSDGAAEPTGECECCARRHHAEKAGESYDCPRRAAALRAAP